MKKTNLLSLFCLISLLYSKPILAATVQISSNNFDPKNKIEKSITEGNFAKAFQLIKSSSYSKNTKQYLLAQYYGAIAKANWDSNKEIAKTYFRKVIELYPSVEKSNLIQSNYALALIRVEKNYEKASQILLRVIKNNPDFGEAYLNSYVANFYLQNYKEAFRLIKIYVDRLDEFEPNPANHHKRYYSLIFSGIRSKENVSNYYQKFLQVAPEEYLKSRLVSIGFAAQTVSDSNWIRIASSDLISLFPKSPQGYNMEVSYHINQGDYQKAIEKNLEYIANPNLESASFYRSLVGLYTQTREFTKGIQIAQQCIEEYGVDYLPCKYSLGTLYWIKSDYELAKKTYESIIAETKISKFLFGSNKNNVLLNAYAGLAKTHADLKENNSALKYAELSDELYSPNADTLIARGIVYMNQGDFEQAKDYLQKGINIYNSGSHFFPKSTGAIAQNYYNSL